MMTPVRQGSTLITDSDRWLPFYRTRLTWSPQFQAGPLWCRRLAALAWGLHHQAPTCRPIRVLVARARCESSKGHGDEAVEDVLRDK